MDTSNVVLLLSSLPLVESKRVQYGTAGFRAEAQTLAPIFLKMGILSLLRSKSTKQAVGVMVTASHNPICDNGMKIIDPDGGMLDTHWEDYATRLANSLPEDIPNIIADIVSRESISLDTPGKILIGRDTRPSCEGLIENLVSGIRAIAQDVDLVQDFGLLTTPQLHHIVYFHNRDETELATESGYYDQTISSFCQLLQKHGARQDGKLIVDCANGVGGYKVRALVEAAHKQGKSQDFAVLDLRNEGIGDSSAFLNEGVGAEWVQKGQQIPGGVDPQVDTGIRCASIDGDADRCVFFCIEDGVFSLFDGDRIAVLIAIFVREQLLQVQLQDGVTIAVIQTAYANGASTMYIRQTLNIPAPLVKTGVKHLHARAHDFDIGIYFEANGHGTVRFSENVLDVLGQIQQSTPENSPENIAATTLLLMSKLVNQSTGDAISVFLVVEAILAIKRWTLADWKRLYADLPSRQTKVVADRTQLTTIDDETRLITPQNLQLAIDEVVQEYPLARAFVRPSGTEDVVRVYAESDTQTNADSLALRVAQLVCALANGVPQPQHV